MRGVIKFILLFLYFILTCIHKVLIGIGALIGMILGGLGVIFLIGFFIGIIITRIVKFDALIISIIFFSGKFLVLMLFVGTQILLEKMKECIDSI